MTALSPPKPMKGLYVRPGIVGSYRSPPRFVVLELDLQRSQDGIGADREQ